MQKRPLSTNVIRADESGVSQKKVPKTKQMFKLKQHMSANVKKAAGRTIPITPTPKDFLPTLQKKRADMLPVEAGAILVTNTVIADLEKMARAAKKAEKYDIQILSPEIFDWKKGGLPMFAAFDVNGDGECSVDTRGFRKCPSSCAEGFVSAIRQFQSSRRKWLALKRLSLILALITTCIMLCAYYGEQMEAGVMLVVLGTVGGIIATVVRWTIVHERELQITTRLGGVIPETTRAKIRSVEKKFEEIFILAEAKWELSRAPVIAPGDPLVVGWDKDYFWLIDVFDTTPVENLVSQEYCERPDVG